MTDEQRQKIALFRYGIIAPVISGLEENSTSLHIFFVMLPKRFIKTIKEKIPK